MKKPSYDFTACRLFAAVVFGRADIIGGDTGHAAYRPTGQPHPDALHRCPSCSSRAVVMRLAVETWRAGPGPDERRWVECLSCHLIGPSGYGHPFFAIENWNEFCTAYV